jgi:hypothetical protein
MKRVGSLLICIAGAVALSITARGDITPMTSNPDVLRQSMNLTNRMMLMKRHHMNKGFPQFSRPIPPQPNLPQARLPQPRNDTATVAHANTASVSAAVDADSGNPYDSIVTRNVFALNPIPPAVDTPAPTGPPPPKITLTGITTIFGPAEALFKVAGVVRGNGRPQDESYIFTEGEQQDDVEVTRIDTNKMIVSFMNHGVQQEVPLSDGVASSGSAPSAPSWPGQPRMRRFPGGRFNPGNPGGFQPKSYSPSSYGGGNGNNSSQNGNGAFNYAGQSSNFHNNSYVSPGISQLSDEDQQALVAAAHAQAAADPNSSVPPEMFPPTKFDDEAQKDSGAGNPPR